MVAANCFRERVDFFIIHSFLAHNVIWPNSERSAKPIFVDFALVFHTLAFGVCIVVDFGNLRQLKKSRDCNWWSSKWHSQGEKAFSSKDWEISGAHDWNHVWTKTNKITSKWKWNRPWWKLEIINKHAVCGE